MPIFIYRELRDNKFEQYYPRDHLKYNYTQHEETNNTMEDFLHYLRTTLYSIINSTAGKYCSVAFI